MSYVVYFLENIPGDSLHDSFGLYKANDVASVMTSEMNLKPLKYFNFMFYFFTKVLTLENNIIT